MCLCWEDEGDKLVQYIKILKCRVQVLYCMYCTRQTQDASQEEVQASRIRDKSRCFTTINRGAFHGGGFLLFEWRREDDEGDESFDRSLNSLERVRRPQQNIRG